MNAYLLVDAVVQQTMVFIAQLATAGGIRAPLAHVAGHPLEEEAKTLLRGTRVTVEDLRARIDAHNRALARPRATDRVVFYAGQQVRDRACDAEGDRTHES